MPRVRYSKCPIQQADVIISQATPTSTQLYTVLDTTKNVQINGIGFNVTWTVTQPNPLELIVTVDGQVLTYAYPTPVSATFYYPVQDERYAETSQQATSSGGSPGTQNAYKACSGRSVKIQVRVTCGGGGTFTPLVCRVKWAIIP